MRVPPAGLSVSSVRLGQSNVTPVRSHCSAVAFVLLCRAGVFTYRVDPFPDVCVMQGGHLLVPAEAPGWDVPVPVHQGKPAPVVVVKVVIDACTVIA